MVPEAELGQGFSLRHEADFSGSVALNILLLAETAEDTAVDPESLVDNLLLEVFGIAAPGLLQLFVALVVHLDLGVLTVTILSGFV